MRIVFCNGKGGAGKTTASALIAHALAEAGTDVSLLDLDPQATATKWLGTSDDTKVRLYDNMNPGEHVVVDTAPRLDLLHKALKGADAVIVVSTPSPADLWTTQDTVKTILEAAIQEKAVRLLFNGVQTKTVLARELPDLAKRIGARPLKQAISRRQCYQHAALLGWRSLTSDAREEILKAALEIISLKG